MGTDNRTIEAYNENAEAYNKHVLDPKDSIYHAYYEKPAIRAELPDLTGLDVLSIGCGSGVDAEWLSQNGAHSVVGIDISDGMIGVAKASYPNIDFHVMDMEALEFPDGHFDLLYSSLAMHYLDDWAEALKEAYRVLKPGGVYIFSCSHPIDTAIEMKQEDEEKSGLLGRTIDRAGVRTLYGNYLAPESNGIVPVDGALGVLPVRIYHRPLGKMIDQIHAAELTIQRMVEPLPMPEMEKIDPDIYHQLMRLPAFMIWSLRKDPA